MNWKIEELLQNQDIKNSYHKLNEHKENFVTKIRDCACKNGDYFYWPLCLDDARDKNSLEIDTCSTSYCVSILSIIKSRTQTNDYDECIKGGLKTLLKLRLANGTFPPVIDIDSLNKRSVEYSGGIAMSDNYFALTTFLDAGFLNEEFEYTDILPRNLMDYEQRVMFVLDTIKFFGDNMVAQSSTGGAQSGWYYTSDTNEKEPVFLTTINIVLILNRIIKILGNDPRFKNEISYIIDIAQKGTNFLNYNARTIDLHGNQYYGIGDKIESSTVSLIHTCKMIDAFISSCNPDFNDEIVNALLMTILKMCADWFFADTYNYSERFQLLKSDKTKYQNILHESYPESVVLFTIINILKFSLTAVASAELKRVIAEQTPTISSTIRYLMNGLKRQRSRNDQFNGFFKSHIRRNDGDYPIYASAESYKAIIAWEDLLRCLQKSNSLTIPTAIDFKRELESQITLLEKFKTDPEHNAKPDYYATAIKACEPLIQKLHAMLSVLSDSNYLEQQNNYNNILRLDIQRILG